MIIVSNTTPIITLVKIDKLLILKELFGEVYIPKGVYEELISNNAFKEEAQVINKCEYIKVVTIKNELAVKLIQKNLGLDLGESEAIVLSEELNSDILIIDEKKGRTVAKSMDINVAGTLGLLIQAKDRGIITNIRVILDSLIESNIRISTKLYEDILNKAGEE